MDKEKERQKEKERKGEGEQSVAVGYHSIKELLFRAVLWQMRENVCACKKKNAVVFSVIICSLKSAKLYKFIILVYIPVYFGWLERDD